MSNISDGIINMQFIHSDKHTLKIEKVKREWIKKKKIDKLYKQD